MGGNGAPSTYHGIPTGLRAPYNVIPSAGGGGCVTTGPFKDMVVSLGPKAPIVDGIPKNPQADGMGANPRCLRRDVNRNSALGATANYTLSLIQDNADIDGFYNRYLGQPPLKNDAHPWGVSLFSSLLSFCFFDIFLLCPHLTPFFYLLTPHSVIAILHVYKPPARTAHN